MKQSLPKEPASLVCQRCEPRAPTQPPRASSRGLGRTSCKAAAPLSTQTPSQPCARASMGQAEPCLPQRSTDTCPVWSPRGPPLPGPKWCSRGRGLWRPSPTPGAEGMPSPSSSCRSPGSAKGAVWAESNAARRRLRFSRSRGTGTTTGITCRVSDQAGDTAVLHLVPMAVVPRLCNQRLDSHWPHGPYGCGMGHWHGPASRPSPRRFETSAAPRRLSASCFRSSACSVESRSCSFARSCSSLRPCSLRPGGAWRERAKRLPPPGEADAVSRRLPLLPTRTTGAPSSGAGAAACSGRRRRRPGGCAGGLLESSRRLDSTILRTHDSVM